MVKFAVFATTVCAATAVAIAAPAQADQFDFISVLDNSGVSYESIVDMIDIGKEVCHDLRIGAQPPVVLGKLTRTGFAPYEAGIVLMSAVNNMCLDTRAAVVDWAYANTATAQAAHHNLQRG